MKFKTVYENLNIKYREEMHLNEQKKYMYASLMFPAMAFAVFWATWEFSEFFVLNYKGKTRYVEKASKEGKDLSIVVTQIR